MRWKLLALLVIGGVVAGCARHRQGGETVGGDIASVLRVANHHWGDVEVYVVREGQRQRVGMVTATSEETFTLPPYLTNGVGTIQLQAHAVGMLGGVTSERFAVRQGMQISWTLETDLARASLTVY